MTEMTSTRPYLIRALHEWILDNGMTPYLVVDAGAPEARVPPEYVDAGKIIFNVSTGAARHLVLGNDVIEFGARFGGRTLDVSFPTTAVLAIYAKENGQGLIFSEQDEPKKSGPEPGKVEKPHLTVVK
ncbi:MAG: stringent starvation protein B [Gammaproteobacteria bacterium]|nr:MAG: stringent starvation protein B [Gammaproteobacteria bacterium]TND02703.1 MAG: stringent starvation protein B [Gammaproteobacteria bacterium]